MTNSIPKDINASAGDGQLPGPFDEKATGAPIDPNAQPTRQRGFKRIRTAGIFDPLPPHKWICEYLGWTAGRPAMIQGYSYSGKTIIVQSAVLHLAASRKLWASNGYGGIGERPERGFRVLHVDHEQGESATRRRYQRLAHGMNLLPDDLEDRLDLVCFPDVSLASKDAEAIYLEECKTPDHPEHVDLCIVDSLRAATPGIDENDSRMGDVMSLLARVSDKTRTAFVVIHHEGKSAGNRGDQRETGRGSSAIFAGAGSVIRVLGGTDQGDDRPRKLEQIKNAAEAKRGAMTPFYLNFRNALHDRDPDGALCIDYLSKEHGDAAWEDASRNAQPTQREQRSAPPHHGAGRNGPGNAKGDYSKLWNTGNER